MTAALEYQSSWRRSLITGPRAAANTAVWLLKVFPMLPSRPVNWVTPRPVVERMTYPTSLGEAVSELYRPSNRGPHPGVVVCLGVVPFGIDHPQVPRLGEALARSGFAALLYWSPAMRDFRLDPVDVEDFASAYEALLARPDIDAARSGVLGTCVGGAFALMGAASPRIRDRVHFALAYAAYASMWTLARDIASASRFANGRREPWAVDPLTRKVFVHTVTALLEPSDAHRLRDEFAERRETANVSGLSDAQRLVAPLLTALSPDDAEDALRRLPEAMQERLIAMSPISCVRDIRAPIVVLLHDRDDVVVPVGESRCLRDAFADPDRVRYTEFTVFKHLDPTKGKPSPIALTRELFRFGRAIFPLFEQAATANGTITAARSGSAGEMGCVPMEQANGGARA
jgi:hypothetical protein